MVAIIMGFASLAQAAVPESFAPIVEPRMNAVVNISTTQKVKLSPAQAIPFNFDNLPDDPQFAPFKDFMEQFKNQMGQQQPERDVTSLGSGFVIDASGYIVTNNHVVAQADEVTITFHDDTKLKAKIIGTDAKTDLALLKVEAPKPLTYVNFGDSDALKVGDWVIAVGNPFGLGGSVSAGIVSARGRNINAGPFDDFIQTDAAINRGNSGGPLFDTKGDVVGINSAIFSPTGGSVGIGFAVPSSMAKSIIEQLRKNGSIKRGWLGVKIQEVTDEVADSIGLDKARGALVLEVSPDGPAKNSGIQAGDVIVKFNGEEVSAMRSLPRMVAETDIGKRSEVTVWRKGHEQHYTVKLGQLPEDAKDAKPQVTGDKKPNARKQAVYGMALAPINREIRQTYRIPAHVQGLFLLDIQTNSEAAARGLQPGDVLVEANQESLDSIAKLESIFKAAKTDGRGYVLLRVVRADNARFVTLPVR
ncbi:MAG: DegQ family serine endoprotease [Rickettsiales bacterium]